MFSTSDPVSLGHLRSYLEVHDVGLTIPEWASFLVCAFPDEYEAPPPPLQAAATKTRAQRIRLLARRQRSGKSLWHPGDQIRLDAPWADRPARSTTKRAAAKEQDGDEAKLLCGAA